MIGVVADDITGSNDIGIMFAKSNYITDIFHHQDWDLESSTAKEKRDVLILDTDSRFDQPKTAYDKVFEATTALKKAGANRFFNKVCSVFRGNIGAEFDAMLDALEEEFAIVVLGFPKNGRTTIDGIHYVYDQKLEESEFRNDPMHPMIKSNLVEILQSQTKRKVGLINFDVVQEGSETLKSEIDKLKGQYNYIILDVTEQADLQTIAKAVNHVKVICGSSALAEELPTVWSQKSAEMVSIDLPCYSKEKGLLCAAGSLMTKTADQIQYMREKGAIVLELESLQLFNQDTRKHQLHSLADQIVTYMEKGADVILHSSNDYNTVDQTKKEGLRLGFTNKEISRLVSGSIAEIVQNVIERTGQNRLLVAGGDTSAAVCSKLSVRGMRVWKEIQPGLPSCVSLSIPALLLVLKSGSFGQPNFFEKAFAHLREQ
ncbi:four-carbon acid sugar kinase family protein [Lederbergia citrea]|uniref:four-carbon acid sugar kinase family protein n=1 Tax=Lederbergia citrea TaxID=2833581 RepID=UPI001BCA2D8E|nr:four-carbon acid sugar kinase family protein [Lederbergia citrea]MBS4205202.1 four-carbon acid sugar kinase family protein [Lederbergia citrea]